MQIEVKDRRGNLYRLDAILGRGGQGAVFPVRGNRGKGLVVKAALDPLSGEILRDEQCYRRWERKLERIMALPELPNLARPLVILEKPCCGYVMRLMEDMVPLSRFFKPFPGVEGEDSLLETMKQQGGLGKRLLLLRNLAELLRDLHLHGLVYGDLSPENVFVSQKPEDHELWLIDLDNLCYESDISFSVGTPFYRAPEIAAGSRNTMAADCYSFALLAFECLTLAKPFNGTAMEREEEEEDFGDDLYEKIETGEIPYIYEEQQENLPCYGFTTAPQLVMTEELQGLFYETFGEAGRKNPRHRPTMAHWAEALNRACGRLCLCSGQHPHFGRRCAWCGEVEQAVYCIRAYEEIPLLHEGEGKDADPVWETEKRPLYARLLALHPRKGRPANWRISIPWKLFHPLERGEPGRRTAFELAGSGAACRIEKHFSPELQLRLLQKPSGDGPAGLLLQATEGGRRYIIEIAEEENDELN